MKSVPAAAPAANRAQIDRPAMSRAPLTTDFSQAHRRPYFLWDEALTVEELRQRLHGSDRHERLRLLAKLLREARDIDVWAFVTPAEVAAAFPSIQHRLGRRRAFWAFLLEGWREDGVLRG